MPALSPLVTTPLAAVTTAAIPSPTALRSSGDLAPVRGLRLSFRWWESLPRRTCACGQPLDVLHYEPSYHSLKDDGCWDGNCPRCGRVVTLYDLGYRWRQPPRGPAPTQYQRETLGWGDDDALAAWLQNLHRPARA